MFTRATRNTVRTTGRQRTRSIRPLTLLLAFVLIVVGAVLFANQGGLLPAELMVWWPAGLIGLSVLFMLIALIRRRPTAMLFSAAVLGLAISLLLHTRGIVDFRATAVGILLISVGTAAVLRALLGMGIAPLAE